MRDRRTDAGAASRRCRIGAANAMAVVAVAACLALVGCRSGASVTVTTSVPRPLVTAMPVKVGVYYDDIITHYVHDEDIEGYGRFEIDVGASQVPAFERVFDAMFQTVIPVGGRIAHILPPPVDAAQQAANREAKRRAEIARKRAQRKAEAARKKAEEKADRKAEKEAKREAKRKAKGKAQKRNKETDHEDEAESEEPQSAVAEREEQGDGPEDEQEVATFPEPPPIDPVEIMGELRRQSVAIDALLVPRIRDFQFSLPRQTRTDLYEVWIRYQIFLYAPDGSEIAEWEVHGYGKTDSRNYIVISTRQADALTDATIWALRDAAAYISFYFPHAPGVKEWLASVTGKS